MLRSAHRHYHWGRCWGWGWSDGWRNEKDYLIAIILRCTHVSNNATWHTQILLLVNYHRPARLIGFLRWIMQLQNGVTDCLKDVLDGCTFNHYLPP